MIPFVMHWDISLRCCEGVLGVMEEDGRRNKMLNNSQDFTFTSYTIVLCSFVAPSDKRQFQVLVDNRSAS